jgi:hypothetical protein
MVTVSVSEPLGSSAATLVVGIKSDRIASAIGENVVCGFKSMMFNYPAFLFVRITIICIL